MAGFKFKLSDELADKVEAVASELREFLTDATDAYDERSESWQDSDKGTEVSTWLESIESVADALEGLERDVT
jgi:hypothetical protein